MMKIPVLMYHHISNDNDRLPDQEKVYRVSRDRFIEQMDLIVQHRIKVVCPDELTDHAEGRCVIVTFDDGYKDNYLNAYPVLLERGMKAVFFVTVGLIGSPGYLSWDDLNEMTKNGMRVGSHGMTHKFFNDLAEDSLLEELSESKSLILKKTGHSAAMLSLPGGRGHARLGTLASIAGYEYCFGSKTSASVLDDFLSRGDVLGQIPRLPVLNRTTIQYFTRMLLVDDLFMFRMKMTCCIKNVLNDILGNRTYGLLCNIKSRILSK